MQVIPLMPNLSYQSLRSVAVVIDKIFFRAKTSFVLNLILPNTYDHLLHHDLVLTSHVADKSQCITVRRYEILCSGVS